MKKLFILALLGAIAIVPALVIITISLVAKKRSANS